MEMRKAGVVIEHTRREIKIEDVHKVGDVLSSPQSIQVRRRIFRQLIESLMFEGILKAIKKELSNGDLEYRIKGQSEAGNSVIYLCRGKRKLSFGRIRLSRDVPVKRIENGGEKEAECLATFICEVAPFLEEEPKQLSRFINELHETWLKDSQAQHFRQMQYNVIHPNERDYDDLEGDIMDAHPYHPCYKSRIGFDFTDNKAFGPDFRPIIKLLWVAVQKDYIRISESTSIKASDFIEKEIGEKDHKKYTELLKEKGLNPERYLFLPIHPWQWREKIMSAFIPQIKSGQIIIVGEGGDEYSPQTSIRTLANRTELKKSYVKLPLSIINTSALRTLGSHHVENAPLVSDWLESILEDDNYLKSECRLIFLKEVLGQYYDNEKLPHGIQNNIYGTLGAIWRESVHSYLVPDEKAVPFTSICHLNVDGRPFIDSWVQEFGLENWLKELLQTAVVPLIHLMYAHGISLESHAQNMVLVHRKGIPVRIALKDFPGGIRYYIDDSKDKSKDTLLKGTSSFHTNHNSSMSTHHAHEVRDYLLDGFFHINLGEIALFLEEQYGLDEHTYWGLVSETIWKYQKRFPQFNDKYELFNLFDKTIEVGQLTIRRLCGEKEKRDHAVLNPLYLFNKKNL